jgi:osmoprotectant transport system substrate-binding protein
VINRSKTSDPRVTGTLDQISSRLDTATLTDLNRRLAGPDRPDPAQVARDWLASAGIA